MEEGQEDRAPEKFIPEILSRIVSERILRDFELLFWESDFCFDREVCWWRVLSSAADEAIAGDDVYAATLGRLFARSIKEAGEDPKMLLGALGLARKKGRAEQGWRQPVYGVLQVALIERHGFSTEKALEFAADLLCKHDGMTVERSTLQRWRSDAENRLARVSAKRREDILRSFEEDARK